MFNHIRLASTSLLMSLFLVACGDDSVSTAPTETTPTPAAESKTNTSSSEVATTSLNPAVDSLDSITAGQSEEEVTKILGNANFSETHSIDDLTVTHSEWQTADGLVSVQFHNGKVTFHQFIAHVSAD
jgi:hypothetical protein